MRDFTISGGVTPNLGHPVNNGKVMWLLNPGNHTMAHLPELMGTNGVMTMRGSVGGAWRVGGASRPGALGPAYRLPTSSPEQHANANMKVNRFTANAEGFTASFWCFLLSTTSTVLLQKGTASVSTNGTGWGIHTTASGQAFVLIIGRATTGVNDTITNTTLCNLRQWYRVTVTWRALGTTGLFYVNGINQPATTTVAGAGAINVEGFTQLQTGVSSGGTFQYLGWFDDICLWNRALNPAEVWEDYVESSTGYRNALIWPGRHMSSVDVSVFEQGVQKGFSLGSHMDTAPEVRKGFALGSAAAFILPDQFDTMTKGFSLGSSMQTESDLLPHNITKGFALGSQLGKVEEIRQGFALGATASLVLVDPVGNVEEGFALGSRFKSDIGELANARYRR